jgi:hypothetical protein
LQNTSTATDSTDSTDSTATAGTDSTVQHRQELMAALACENLLVRQVSKRGAVLCDSGGLPWWLLLFRKLCLLCQLDVEKVLVDNMESERVWG